MSRKSKASSGSSPRSSEAVENKSVKFILPWRIPRPGQQDEVVYQDPGSSIASPIPGPGGTHNIVRRYPRRMSAELHALRGSQECPDGVVRGEIDVVTANTARALIASPSPFMYDKQALVDNEILPHEEVFGTPKPPETKEQLPDFDTMTKLRMLTWAKEHGIFLDPRKKRSEIQAELQENVE